MKPAIWQLDSLKGSLKPTSTLEKRPSRRLNNGSRKKKKNTTKPFSLILATALPRNKELTRRFSALSTKWQVAWRIWRKWLKTKQFEARYHLLKSELGLLCQNLFPLA